MDENNGTILRNRCVDDRQIDVEEDDDKFDVGRSCIGGNNELQLSCIEPTFPLKAANISPRAQETLSLPIVIANTNTNTFNLKAANINPRAQETDAIVIAYLILTTSNLIRF